jgi:hypothetical protein
MKNLVVAAVCACALSAGFAASANAALIVNEGILVADGGWNMDNVISGACTSSVTGASTTITGCLQSEHDFGVEFTSDEQIRFAASGQSRIEAVDGGFSELTIGTKGPDLFDILVLNIDLMNRMEGWVTFIGTPGGSSDPFKLGNGQNFFTITGDEGEGFEAISFRVTDRDGNAIDAAADVQQVRLGTLPESIPDTVPEPTSMVLMGLGFLGAGFAARRRQ